MAAEHEHQHFAQELRCPVPKTLKALQHCCLAALDTHPVLHLQAKETNNAIGESITGMLIIYMTMMEMTDD